MVFVRIIASWCLNRKQTDGLTGASFNFGVSGYKGWVNCMYHKFCNRNTIESIGCVGKATCLKSGLQPWTVLLHLFKCRCQGLSFGNYAIKMVVILVVMNTNGFEEYEIVRVLAGQPMMVAAMADAFSFFDCWPI